MSFKHLPFLLVLATGLTVSCDKNGGEPSPVPTTPTGSAETRSEATTTAAAQTPEEFIAELGRAFPHEVTGSRTVKAKRGKIANIYRIDYTEGRIKTIDDELSTVLGSMGFERQQAESVRGGIRVAYVADDGRSVSTLIRNKKYFKDRIAADSAGQVSVSYIIER